MFDPISMGVMSFASSAMGAWGNYSSQQQQTRAANKAAMEEYKYKLKIRSDRWDRSLATYRNQLVDYQLERGEQDAAYSRALEANQYNLNQTYKQASFADQEAAIKLADSQGKLQARNVSGRTADRLNTAVASQFGRNQAMQTESLLGASYQSKMQSRNLREQLKSSARQSYSKIMTPPVPDSAPLAPTMQSGPSSMGLYTGLLGAGISGYQTYDSLLPKLD